MIVIDKSHQNVSDYIHFLSENYLNLIKKAIISSEKIKIRAIITMIMLTRS